MLAIRWRLKSELADAAYELAIDLQTGDQLMITARYVLDATEEADLLPLRECGWGSGCGIGLAYRRATRPGRLGGSMG